MEQISHLILRFNSDVVGETSSASEIEEGHPLPRLLKIQFQTKHEHIVLVQPVIVAQRKSKSHLQ